MLGVGTIIVVVLTENGKILLSTYQCSTFVLDQFGLLPVNIISG